MVLLSDSAHLSLIKVAVAACSPSQAAPISCSMFVRVGLASKAKVSLWPKFFAASPSHSARQSAKPFWPDYPKGSQPATAKLRPYPFLLKGRTPAMALQDDNHDYHALIVLQAVGFSWSESANGMSFGEWTNVSFPHGFSLGHAKIVTGGQFEEFSTGIPTRTGSEPMVKPKTSVVEGKYPKDFKPSSGVVRLSLRTIRTSGVRLEDLVYDTPSFEKLWLAVRIQKPLQTGVVSRESFRRSHPRFIHTVFATDEDRNIVKNNIEHVVDKAMEELVNARQKRKPDRKTKNSLRDSAIYLQCMKRLLEWFDPPQEGAPRPDIRSTEWIPGRPRDKIIVPGDITRHSCICCSDQTFARWISTGCGGVGAFRVTPTTLFGDEQEILNAIMHDCKFQLLSKLRTCAIDHNDIIRCVIAESQPDRVRLAARLWSMTHRNEEQKTQWDATDKHRIIFLCPQEKIQEIAKNHFTQTASSSMAIGDDILDDLWSMGSLHVLDSAPRYAYATRFSINPRCLTVGDHIGIMLAWCGNWKFYHQAIAQYKRQGDPCSQLGIMRPLFMVHREGSSIDRPCHPAENANIFHGRCGPTEIEDFERNEGFQMARDQRDCLSAINGSKSSMFHITALAGTGKTTILCFLLHCLIPTLENTKNVAVVLVPGKNLRDEVLTNLDMLGPVYKNHPATKVLWLGQQAENSDQVTYEAKIVDEVKNILAPQRRHLAGLEDKIRKSRNESKSSAEKQWKVFCSSNLDHATETEYPDELAEQESEFLATLEISEKLPNMIICMIFDEVPNLLSEFLATREISEKLDQVRDSLSSYFLFLNSCIKSKKGGIIADLVQDVRIVVATADAWCKFKAGYTKGTIARCLQDKKPVAGFLDECESYGLLQTLATASQEFQTLVFSGDKNQRLESRSPMYTRSPWQGPKAPGRTSLIELDIDEQEDFTEGQETQGGNTIKNPEERPFYSWLNEKNCQILKLRSSKRFGRVVCNFLQSLFDFCEDFQPHETAPNTQLWHVFYDGRQWCDKPGALPDQSPQGSIVQWHSVLFRSLFAMIFYELAWLRELPDLKPINPKILIVCPLARVQVPLATLCSLLWGPTEVQVMLVHGARGKTAYCVHFLRHRRYIGSEDQFHGLQGDLTCQYISTTRGSLKVTVWMEHQPFGMPGNSRWPKVPMLQAKKEFAHKVNHALDEERQARWFELKETRHCQWPDQFAAVFGEKFRPDDRSISKTMKALESARTKLQSGITGPEDKRKKPGGDQYRNVNDLFRRMTHKEDPAHIFAFEPLSYIRSLDREPAVRRYHVVIDCIPHLLSSAQGIHIDLSAKPEGGMTRLSLHVAETDEVWANCTELCCNKYPYTPTPIVNALESITFRVAESVYPDLIKHRQKAEVNEELGFSTCPTSIFLHQVLCRANSWKWAASFSVAVFVASHCTLFEPIWLTTGSIKLKPSDGNSMQDFLKLCEETKRNFLKNERFIRECADEAEMSSEMVERVPHWLFSAHPDHPSIWCPLYKGEEPHRFGASQDKLAQPDVRLPDERPESFISIQIND